MGICNMWCVRLLYSGSLLVRAVYSFFLCLHALLDFAIFFSIFFYDSFRSYIRRLCGISTVQIQKTTTLRPFSLAIAALVSPYLININLTTCYDSY